jgi:hypothetical protein
MRNGCSCGCRSAAPIWRGSDRVVVDGGYPSRAAVLSSIVHAVAEDDRACEAQPVATRRVECQLRVRVAPSRRVRSELLQRAHIEIRT